MGNRYETDVEQLLLRNYDKYYRLAYSYVKSEQDALDIVQESAYKAIRDSQKVKSREYMETWLYRIVINTSIDFLRKRKKEVLMEVEWEGQEMNPQEGTELKEVLEKLEEKERTVIILRYVHELKLDEISQIVGENVNTVKARLYRTLKKLKVEMESEYR